MPRRAIWSWRGRNCVWRWALLICKGQRYVRLNRTHFLPQALDQELATAAKTRPDLAALRDAQSAQATAVGAAKSSFGPHVSAYGNWEEDRGSFTSSGGNNWVAGVQIGIDILPFGKRAELARETATKQRVDAQLASLSAAGAPRGESSAHSPQDRGAANGDGAGRDGSIG